MVSRRFCMILIVFAGALHSEVTAQQRDATLVPAELVPSWNAFWDAWEGDETGPFERVLTEDAVVASSQGLFVGRAAIFERWLGPALAGASVGFQADPAQFLALEDGILEVGEWEHGYQGVDGAWTTGIYSQLWVPGESGWQVRIMTVGDRVLASPTEDSHAGFEQMLAEFRAQFIAADDPASMAGLFAADGAVMNLREGWTLRGAGELETLWTSGFSNHRPFPRDVVYTNTRFLSENIAVVEGRLERGSAEVDGRMVPAQREFFTLVAGESRGRWRIVEARAGGWEAVGSGGS